MEGELEELFRDFWWLLFPIFGMVFALVEMLGEQRRAGRVIAQARRELEGR